ncbi:MAG: hypothetical protein P1P84_02825 [Deferrisomatales bacterium]|nr:hypothetical protein [Deferrisomatales bacterium]
MTVSAFIEWLQTQDQEATVQCIVHDRSGSYYEQGGTAGEEDFTPDRSEYTDFRGYEFVTPDREYFNRRYLLIGVSS